MERFEEKIGRLLQTLMNKSVLDPKAREEIEEILGCFLSEDGISTIQEVVCELVNRAPYLSGEQQEALVEDFNTLFGEINPADIDKTIEKIKKNLNEKKFSFFLDQIPQNTVDVEQMGEERIARAFKLIIEDFFGKLINNLPPDEKLRLRVKIDQAIEREVEDL